MRQRCTDTVEAAEFGFTDSMRLMLAHGADSRTFGAEGGKTLMTCAVRSGKVDAVQLLTGRGVDVDQRDGRGETPLAWAIRSHNSNIANLLRLAGAK